jgi:mannose-1-phosphate guanylyltransferase
VLLGRGVRFGAGAVIIGPTVIGHDTTVGAGTRIESSVIWEEGRIGDGAQITGSILGAYCGIGDGAVVTDAVLGNAAEVEEGHAPEAGIRVMPSDHV